MLLFEKGIRGGITQVVKRYAMANNKYVNDQHNLNEKGTYLRYLDTNNFYGFEMI